MKSQYRMLFAFVAILLAVSMACTGGSTPTPTTVPTNPPPPTSAPQNTQVSPPEQSGTSSDIVTFVDQNNLLAFDLPGDWTYEHVELGNQVYSDADAYSDTFASPDGFAKIESLVIFASTTVTNSVSAGVALDLLHRYYSTTGQVGDIRISSDQIMKDGSERFEWTSKSGGYSGVSFYEVRGSDKRTWLMYTLWWDNNADQTILDTIDNAIGSYYIP
ncbi:MAG: hypothetical protein Q7J80_13740 [Anaerolineales bacterium]|nr:hypothetical protein [Anaerolineales bacterium]